MELQNIVNNFLVKLGINTPVVTVKITKNPKIIAAAKMGGRLGNIAVGEIIVNRNWIDKFLSPELEHILAHELIHINENHLLTEATFKLVGTMIDNLIKDNLVGLVVKNFIQLIDLRNYKQYGKLSFKASITKEQEIDAEIKAILLTRNKTSAISCLKKMVNYDLNQPSHVWETLGIELPVMTIRERIDEINKRISNYEKQGYIFK